MRFTNLLIRSKSQGSARPAPAGRAPEYEIQGTNRGSKRVEPREGGKAAESLKGETLRYPLGSHNIAGLHSPCASLPFFLATPARRHLISFRIQ
jgi:hypothetical protein